MRSGLCFNIICSARHEYLVSSKLGIHQYKRVCSELEIHFCFNTALYWARNEYRVSSNFGIQQLSSNTEPDMITKTALTWVFALLWIVYRTTNDYWISGYLTIIVEYPARNLSRTRSVLGIHPYYYCLLHCQERTPSLLWGGYSRIIGEYKDKKKSRASYQVPNRLCYYCKVQNQTWTPRQLYARYMYFVLAKNWAKSTFWLTVLHYWFYSYSIAM